MSRLKSDLKVANNMLSSYFPSRTSVAKEGDFDWGVAKAAVIKNLYRKKINTKIFKSYKEGSTDKERFAINAFKDQCQKDFKARLDDVGLWEHIENMYFNADAVYNIAPESLLFKLAPLTANSAQNRLADMFSGMMQGCRLEKVETKTNNFLEARVLSSLRSECVLEDINDGSQAMSKGINEEAYLPFLSDRFNQDLEFLASKPKYFLEQLENLLRLYAYLYTAQLALNIKNIDTEPSAKPLYFIMGNESASRERTDLVFHGHQTVKGFLKYIFPYLSMSESLQTVDQSNNEYRVPLWKLVSNLEPNDCRPLKEYAKSFAEDRYEGNNFTFSGDETNDDPRHWVKFLLDESVSQFGKKKTRAAAQEKFIRTTETELCFEFAKARGQVGRVLVMNQDYIALITNLAVGFEDKLRFSDLLIEFKERGIYFDKQSQKALIRFYERSGNVERMSDSGDAVYVRKTL